MVDSAQIREAIERSLPTAMEDLKRLVAIPSVSSQPQHRDDLDRAAQMIVGRMNDLGADDVSVVSAGGAPAVIAHFRAGEDLPTVCLYAHMDVQPTGDVDEWTSPPFAPERRGDRLYGRGTADDKGGVACHLAVLEAFKGQMPVNVTVLIEGEEEMGSPTLADILAEHKDALAADVYVIADCGNWAIGQPAFTTSLRGVADCVVEVRTLEHAIHSGQFGGVVPDALTTLCRLLATLHDEDGNVAVEGLKSIDGPELPYDEATVRRDTGLLDGVSVIGTGPLSSRTWQKPSISVIGLDTTPIAESSNTLLPSARARISVRVAPGDTPQNARECLRAHLEQHVEWGAQLSVTYGEAASPCQVEVGGEIGDKAIRAWNEAFGVDPVQIGMGGTIGMIAEFQDAFPEADVLCTAVADPDCRMHGIDESLHVPDWEKTCLAEALFLASLAK